jgi:hypothetical protein
MVSLPGEAGQLEFVLEPGSSALAMYVFDSDGRTPVRLEAVGVPVQVTPEGAPTPTQLTLAAVANAATGEKVGSSSRFEARSQALANVSRLKGVVGEISVRGERFTNVAFDLTAIR